MKDADLLAEVLGIVPPWRVSSVELKTDEARIDIFLEHDKGVRWECPKCGRLTGVRDHIRHVAASNMLANGADLAAVTAQLGHQNVATTGATYAHVTQGSQQIAARALGLPSRTGNGEGKNG